MTEKGKATFYKFMSAKKNCRFVVKYRTESGRSAPLCELFFCDHPTCLKPVHPFAAMRSIENYFCPQCLSTYPSNIVRKWTRCPKCIMCPACFTTCEKILLMRSNTYLLQCTFCYWLSGPVGIKAKTAMDLVATVKDSNHKTCQELTTQMYDLVKHYKENITTQPSYMLANNKYHNYLSGPRFAWEKLKNRRKRHVVKKKEKAEVFGGVVGGNLLGKSKESCKKLDKTLEADRAKVHDLPKEEADNSWIKPAPSSYVTDISLKRVTGLVHRLEDPMRQPVEFDKLHPQRLRLMTKESFKCPRKDCQNFLCKPVIGARHCSFEVKKLALDYMPHIRLEGPIGNPDLPPKAPSKVYLHLANPLSDPMAVKVTPRTGEPHSTADVTCSPEKFPLAGRDSSARVVWPPLNAARRQAGDNFTSNNMCGIMLTVTPRYFSLEAVEFVLDITCECKYICSDGSSRNHTLSFPVEIQIKPPPPAKATRTRSPRVKRPASSSTSGKHKSPKPASAGKPASGDAARRVSANQPASANAASSQSSAPAAAPKPAPSDAKS